MWPCVIYLIRNQDGLNGLPPHNHGILPSGSYSANLVEWWVMFSEDYGYGIFHSARVDQTTGALSFVHLGVLDSDGLDLLKF